MSDHVECAKAFAEIEAENAQLRAEVERLQTVKESYHQQTLTLSNDLAAVLLQVRDLLAWARKQRDEAGKSMDIATEVGPNAFWRGKWNVFTELVNRLSEGAEKSNCDCHCHAPRYIGGCGDCASNHNVAEKRKCEKCGVAHEPKEQPFCER